MSISALNNIQYGLFVLTTNDGTRDNGCIINTVMQTTGYPEQIAISVCKQNYTHDALLSTKKFNISVLCVDTPFSVFERFGFQSGRDVDKFSKFSYTNRSQNGMLFLTQYSNSYISCEITNQIDVGTHTVFFATVLAMDVLSDIESVTYSFYHKNIKPKPSDKKGWRCKICNFVYEGDPLPDDYICPICKHGAADFEKII